MKPTENTVFFTSLELLNAATTSIVELTPKKPRELPILEFTPMRIFWQVVTKGQAIHHLLSEGFISEAAIILRSLMFDAHHLIYLSKHPTKRDALVLSLREQEIRGWQDLAVIAKEANVENAVEPIHRKAREEHQKVQRKMKDLRIAKLSKFPAQGANMARSLGRLGDIVGHKMYSLMVHSTALSPVGIGITKMEGRGIGLHLRDKNAKLVQGAAHSATEYLFEASIGIASWQEWSSLEELKAKYATITSAFTDLDLHV